MLSSTRFILTRGSIAFGVRAVTRSLSPRPPIFRPCASHLLSHPNRKFSSTISSHNEKATQPAATDQPKISYKSFWGTLPDWIVGVACLVLLGVMFRITVKRDKRDNMRRERMEAKLSKYFDEWAKELQEFRKWKNKRMQVKDDEALLVEMSRSNEI